MKKVYLIAVVFALLAGFATYMFASQINKKTTIKDADTVAVVFADQDIPANTMITEDMVADDAGYFHKKEDVIKEDATPSPITDKGKLVGMVTSVDIHAGEQLNEFKFVSSDDEEVGLSYKLESGKVAFSFTASSTNGVDGYISAGDTVDIITYSTDDDGKITTNVAYKDLNVIRVSNASSNQSSKDAKITEYSTITVEVTEKEALRLYEIENTQTFKLVLNSKRDAKTDAALKANQQQAEATSAAAESTSAAD